MGEHRRSDVEIMRDILEVCSNGANKTRIVCRANLNSARLKGYLNIYLAMEMLVKGKDGERVVYRTTRQGIKFLQLYFGHKSAVSVSNYVNSV